MVEQNSGIRRMQFSWRTRRAPSGIVILNIVSREKKKRREKKRERGGGGRKFHPLHFVFQPFLRSLSLKFERSRNLCSTIHSVVCLVSFLLLLLLLLFFFLLSFFKRREQCRISVITDFFVIFNKKEKKFQDISIFAENFSRIMNFRLHASLNYIVNSGILYI